ncbi:MAG: YraN family protein [Candidatus Omnitrophica bacterium]|nr:YraN family protein [Candidatus Omnitrophota bacterium]
MNKRNFGNLGENLAVSFLKEKGYIILERNYRTRFAEIDIIAKDKNEIVFIEVKTRTSNLFGEPQEAVNRLKINKIEKASVVYLEKSKIKIPVRYEVLSIIKNAGSWLFEIIPIE